MRKCQPSWQLHEIGDRARSMVHEFWEANQQEQKIHVHHPEVCWSPPTINIYKANFDAAMFDASDCAGIVVVFRDHSCHVIAALNQKVALP